MIPSLFGLSGVPTSTIRRLFANGEQGAWFDPNDLSTVFQDTAGTLPAVANDPVGRINDKSGNGNHATQVTALKRPTLKVDATGNYYLHFSGSQALATNAINLTATDKASLVVVASKTSNNVALLLETSADGTANNGCLLVFDSIETTGTVLFGVRGTSYCGQKTRPISQPILNVLTCNFDLSQSALAQEILPQVNGFVTVYERLGPGTAAGTGNFGNHALYIGARNQSSYYFNGNVYGLVLRGALTNSADIAFTEATLLGDVTETASLTRGEVIGDSTIAAYLGYVSVPSLMTSATVTIDNLAVPGNTISQQTTAWLSSSGTNRSAAKWVVIEIGLNDLDPTEIAATAIARLQTLVNHCRALTPISCKVFVSKMTPCRARLIALYGATNGPIAYQKWLDINEAIAGGGATPITDVHGRITAHEPLLNDGSGNLAAAYDHGDGIHENDAGRAIIADAWEDALSAAGVL